MTTTETVIPSNGKPLKVTKAPTPKLDEAKAAEVASSQAEMRRAILTTPARQVALDQVDESPFNRRRTWGDLSELAATFLEVGILQDLVGRPHPTRAGRIELVFGARRLRGAEKAHLPSVPMKVLELTDEQVVELIAIENLQRQDIHPIEEAETFEQLREKQGLTADELALKIGKSKAYVYARLKLLALCPDARKAFVDGKLSASVALLVARIPISMQVDALAQLDKAAAAWPHEGKALPFRDAADLLEERYTLDLQGAPFDRKDLTLVPGAGACADCPKRAGNQKGLFEAFGEEPLDDDVCTDPVCFGAKRDASAARVAQKLEDKGVTVMRGKLAKHGHRVLAPKGFVAVTDHLQGKSVEDLLDKARAKAPRTPALKSLEQKTMMVGANGKPVEIVRAEDLRQALNLKEPTAAAPRDWKAENEKRERLEKIERRAADKLMAIVVANVEKMGGKPSLQLLRLLATEAFVNTADSRSIAERRAWTPKKDASWRDRRDTYGQAIAKLDAGELLGLLAEATLSNDDGDFELGYARTAKAFGADLKVLLTSATEEATGEVAPEPAPADAKGGAKPARKAKKAATKKGRKK